MKRLLALALLAACQPTSQLLVHIDADAVVPPRPGMPLDPSRPAWLFDRLRAELFVGGVAASSRDFELDEGLFLDGKASVGVAPRPGDDSVTLRLRLFRGDHALGSQPRALSSVDSTFALPPVDADQLLHVTARLHTDDVGRALGPLAPDDGEPGSSAIGSWPGAAVVPCKGAPQAGEVCIPGGAFWMGDPVIQNLVTGGDADQERLVIMSPFFIDLREATVNDIRANLTQLTPGGFVPSQWNESSDPSLFRTWCTYTLGPTAADPNDAHQSLPANCMDFDSASVFCRMLGKALPSEAQFEFAASGGGAENGFPWGDDEPECVDAVYGLGGIGYAEFNAKGCRIDASLAVVHQPGSGARDRRRVTDARTGDARTIVDLGGNLAEWTRDYFLDQNDPFWSAPGVRKDPLSSIIPPAGSDILHTVRAGGWTDSPIQLRAANRRGVLTYDTQGRYYDYNNIGWRCIRRGT